jgi:transposase
MYYFKRKIKGKNYLYKGHNKKIKGVAIKTVDKYIDNYDALAEYFQRKLNLISIEQQKHYEFGLSKVAYDLSQQLMFEKIFQNNISKRTKDKFLHSRILLMVLNRLVSPVPKYQIKDWFLRSDLVNMLNFPPEELDEHKVYRSMDLMDKYKIDVEEDICKTIMIQEKLSFDMLYLDFTNQETYSNNSESTLLKKGHNKRKRYDLKQINISLNCDAKSGIPFFHKTYPGNMNDPTFIKTYAPELRKQLDNIEWKGRSTLVIDRGINGIDNFRLLRKNRFDYIGGLIEKDYPEFFNIPKSKIRNEFSQERIGKPPRKIRYTSQKTEIYGEKHLIITAYSDDNFHESIIKLNEEMNKFLTACLKKLNEFKSEIQEKTFQSNWNNTIKIKRELEKINKNLFKLFTFDINSYRFKLSWDIKKNKNNYLKYIDNFGKYVIFTNKLDFKPKEVMEYFYKKDMIEKNFQILKSNAYNYKYIILGPMFHKRDDRIESHTFTCILALQLYQLIDYRIKKNKLNISCASALAELRKITCYYTKFEGNPLPIRHINPLSDIQKKIIEALEVKLFN